MCLFFFFLCVWLLVSPISWFWETHLLIFRYSDFILFYSIFFFSIFSVSLFWVLPFLYWVSDTIFHSFFFFFFLWSKFLFLRCDSWMGTITSLFIFMALLALSLMLVSRNPLLRNLCFHKSVLSLIFYISGWCVPTILTLFVHICFFAFLFCGWGMCEWVV